jgi:N-acetyl sugar amidotransferase
MIQSTVQMKIRSYQRCSRCVMDTSDPEISFNEKGLCNHCLRYKAQLSTRVYRGEEASTKLAALVSSIKKAGKGGEYDCIIGVSGGVDSTYVAYLTKQLGLKPLAIHFDNGWNSELAVSNIEKTLKTVGIDLYTYVIDWSMFKELQIAFLKASTPDGEIPTDHAINALLWQEANKRGIKYVINGMNFATESASVPAWAYGHSDWKYIRSVNKLFGKNKRLKGYPHFSLLDLFYYSVIKRIRVVSILNYIDYNKKEVMDVLQNKLGWVYYGGKHYESIYTRFYQAFVLPVKFGIDKRICHMSDLINAKQLGREEALEILRTKDYADDMMKEDLAYVLKKFELTLDDFESIMKAPIKSFRDYPNNYEKVMRIKRTLNKLRKLNIMPR